MIERSHVADPNAMRQALEDQKVARKTAERNDRELARERGLSFDVKLQPTNRSKVCNS
ncbi:hypothetical protein ACMHYB_24650 [Sorangium sp. So ce1128]